MKEILGQLVLSSVAKDVDQIFFSNLSELEMSFLMASALFSVSWLFKKKNKDKV